MVHVETPPYEGMSPFDTFLFDWDSENNNEPFWRRSHELDLQALAQHGGFTEHAAVQVMAPSAYQETQRSMTFQGGDFGGGGVLFLYGCQK